MLLGYVLPKEIVALVWEFVVGDSRKNRARMVHELKMARVALDIKDMRAQAEDQDIEDSIVGIQAEWQHEVDTVWGEGEVPAYLWHSYKWYMTTRKKLMARLRRNEYALEKITQLRKALVMATAQRDVLTMTVIVQQINEWNVKAEKMMEQ